MHKAQQIINIAFVVSLMAFAFSCAKHETIKYSTRKTISQVRIIADQYAEKKGYDLSKYYDPEIEYHHDKQEWIVTYTAKCSGFLFFKKCPFGGEFGITIDDLTGEITYLFQGA